MSRDKMHDNSVSKFRIRESCRACGGRDLTLFLSLGPTPLANAFLRTSDEFKSERTYPLDVHFCEDCSLVQLVQVVDPKILFGNYIYVTGTSATIHSHNQRYAQTVVDLLRLTKNDLVIELASNNGSLLGCFKRLGVKTIGVEPAENIAAMANDSGVNTINRFFNLAAASEIRESYGPASAVIANNVLAHVDDTQDFLKGCAAMLRDVGLVVIEVPYLKEFVDLVEFDTIYHEHLCYFSVASLMRLCESAGLSIWRVERVPVHGGSLRIYAGRSESYGGHSEDVIGMADKERSMGLTSLTRFTDFASKAQDTRNKLRTMLAHLKENGKTIAAYGAPAKGNTLLNFCGIGKDLLDFVVDKNPLKVGLYTPGTHLQVLPVSTLLERQPDYLLILAWNFAEEIMDQQIEYKARGGRFIVPIPEPRII